MQETELEVKKVYLANIKNMQHILDVGTVEDLKSYLKLLLLLNKSIASSKEYTTYLSMILKIKTRHEIVVYLSQFIGDKADILA